VTTTLDLIRRAEAAGATLTPNGNKLRVTPSRPIPAALVEELRSHKEAIVAELTRPPRLDPESTPLEAEVTPEEAAHLTSEELDAHHLRLTLDTPEGRMHLAPRGDRSPRSAEVPTFTTEEERTLRTLPAERRHEAYAATYRAKRDFDPNATVEEVVGPPESCLLDAFEDALATTDYGSSAVWLGPPARWVRDESGWACLRPRFAPGEAALFCDLAEGDGDLLRRGAIPLEARLDFLLKAVAEGVVTKEQARGWAREIRVTP